MPGALENLRVVDFGHYIAGPLAAVMLSDQGADVIHVDAPGKESSHHSDAFFNRGKRRITLDLKAPDDLDTARQLIQGADVVIENFRPGVMERLGLGADAMLAANPRLIYCSLPGFAADDPRASMRAWEGILDAATENCFPRVGEPPEDWDFGRPTYSALPLASNFGAFLGATGIVMALIARERMGRGQKVEVPLFDAMFTLFGHSGAYITERGLHPPTGIHGRGAGCFRCGDGKYVQFDTSSARHLTWFAREAGLTGVWETELLDLTKNRNPQVNQRLHARLRELFLTKTAAEWEEIGNRAGAAMGWARSAQEWLQTDHARRTGMVTEIDDPELGATWMPGLPIHLSATPGSVQGPRHLPDSDRASVLADSQATSPADGTAETEPDLKHPLEGIKVLDLCLALAGPTCGRLLLEFGAEVVKIQKPQAGVGGYLNRGKRSLLLDLEPIGGQEVFWKLVQDADVVLENFSPGTADRLGIGYPEVSARRPDIVYTSISCYGQTGPWRSGRGWERQGQAVAGIMERTGEVPAILGPYNLIDIGTGTLGTFATALAIYNRLRTGQGQHAQASLCQTATYQQAPYMFDFEGYKPNEPRGYAALGNGSLDRFYKGSDGKWFFLAAHLFDEKQRIGSVEGLDGIDATGSDLESRFEKADASTWVARLQAAGVAAQAVVPISDVMTDASVVKRGLSITQNVAGIGEATMPGLSVHLSKTPMRLGEYCHQPGSDGPAILEEIGMADQVGALERSWVLQTTNLPPAWSGG
jgi:crotonobetainyl-CoA:carnitine CoA-transferase CaiB-like acyl-CoA transferase